MASEYRRVRRVEFSDTDAAGIIHFSSYFRYMEETEHAFLRSLGLSVSMNADGRRFGFPRLAARCDFLRPVRFEDEVEIHLRVRRKGRSSLTYQYLFSHGGEAVARGEISAVCCQYDDAGGMKSVPLPASFTEKIDECSLPPLEFRAKREGRGHPAEPR